MVQGSVDFRCIYAETQIGNAQSTGSGELMRNEYSGCSSQDYHVFFFLKGAQLVHERGWNCPLI